MSSGLGTYQENREQYIYTSILEVHKRARTLYVDIIPKAKHFHKDRKLREHDNLN